MHLGCTLLAHSLQVSPGSTWALNRRHSFQVPFLEAVFKEDIPDVRDVLSVWPADSVPDRFRGLKRQVMERKKKGEMPPAINSDALSKRVRYRPP
jgi:hypothetical protein